jgi:hypothetical protein
MPTGWRKGSHVCRCGGTLAEALACLAEALACLMEALACLADAPACRSWLGVSANAADDLVPVFTTAFS